MNNIRFVFLFMLLIWNLAPAQSDSLVINLLFSIGAKGEAPGLFSTPTGISTDASGNIYVADTGNNRIQKFDSRGRLLKFIGGFGWESEQFQRPADICAENALDVFVADYDNHRIERYDKDLNWISSYRNDENLEDKLQFAFPLSVAISIHGDLFIVSAENKNVVKLNTLREPEISFGDYAWGEGTLAEPAGIAVSKSDRIYVADGRAGAVFVYDYYGNFLFNIGQGTLKAPYGICVDANEYLYVTDRELDQVVIFSPAGHPVLRHGATGTKLGAFTNPAGIAVFQNRILVADMDNHRVQVFTVQKTTRK